MLRHIERLKAIRSLGLPLNLDRHVYRNRLLRLAREGAQTAVYQLKDYGESRRYATLVAIVLEAEATLTDEILDLHDRLIGSFFAKAKHKHERAFTEAAPALHETIQLYAKVGTAIVEAKEQQQDPFAAIEALMSWEVFAESVSTASELAATRDVDSLGSWQSITVNYGATLPHCWRCFLFRPRLLSSR